MDIEKLIRRLRNDADAYRNGETLGRAFADQEDVLDKAATALSTLQGENAQLRESRDHWKRLAHELSEGVNGKDAEHERLQTENEKLRAELENYRKGHCSEGGCAAEKDRDAVLAELEQVKAERDAAVSWAQKFTESIDRPCVACKHNTGYYVCTAICGNCGPMGTESCKWEFDFSRELKED